jgi:hypothetical protein
MRNASEMKESDFAEEIDCAVATVMIPKQASRFVGGSRLVWSKGHMHGLP